MSLLRTILGWLRGGASSSGETSKEDRADDIEELPEVVDLGSADTIDLHTFRPKDVPSVVREFLNAASKAGFTRVRIVHGKGIGVQRRIVREVLSADQRVVAFSDATDASGWGATVVHLGSPDDSTDRDEAKHLSD